jgi:hypothetical protein
MPVTRKQSAYMYDRMKRSVRLVGNVWPTNHHTKVYYQFGAKKSAPYVPYPRIWRYLRSLWLCPFFGMYWAVAVSEDSCGSLVVL